ncbi:UDP-N-acetylmuramate--L-alanine ligase [Candidatus Methylomirabilis sp.]|uniref:UDP-N-acetylmuramate--L-alanine ligase n=1 Tax=Candidatus Methylomirabilis tolerans TaxID=3123416 RepID=A0AAJ1EL69_9BACT|nr:UDP-N-acetylmuramate--L-alanine ligase [Candidatus Methylomirabilis sp.]
MFKKIRHIHFVGIGGVGMSGIAEVLHNLGYQISGSDLKISEHTLRLQALGVIVQIGHDSAHVQDADVVVRSSAVSPENPEIVAAKAHAIPVIQRAEMLAELMRMKYGVAVAGTHGKTTTTSMVATVLARAGLDPTVVIGGRLDALGSNAKLGQGEFMVAEADESDGSFLKLTPTIAVVTTIDAEHLDYYRDLQQIKETFLEFINKVPFYGSAILCLDQEEIRDLLPRVQKRIVSYGCSEQADLTAEGVSLTGLGSAFKARFRGEPLGEVQLRVPGLHNISNALAAIAVGLELEIEFAVIRTALGEFSGVVRRFQVKGNPQDIMVVDDYAHHPAEIQATLRAARDGFERRLIAVFQPHRYSRTSKLLHEFAPAFDLADQVIITEIYPAGEAPIDGVSGRRLADGIAGRGRSKVLYVERKEEIPDRVVDLARPGDLVITMGAGDIWKTGEQIVNRLEDRV